MRTMLRLAVPAGLQRLLFAAGFTTLFWIIGRVGTVELAAANVLINLTLVIILPGIGLGMASASLVGQALGRRDADDAKRWGWDVVRVAVVAMVPLGLPMMFATDVVFGIFTTDPAAIAAGRIPLQIIGGSVVLEAVGMVLLQSMLGAGAARTVMIVSISLQWFFFLPIAFVVGPTLGYGLVGIWLVQLAQQLVQAVVFGRLWSTGRWAMVRV